MATEGTIDNDPNIHAATGQRSEQRWVSVEWLPRLDSNQEPTGPKPDVLPITPRGNSHGTIAAPTAKSSAAPERLSRLLRRELGLEPGAGEVPIRLDRAQRHRERFCDLGHRQAPEAAQLDDLGLAFVERREAFERLVEREHGQAAARGIGGCGFEPGFEGFFAVAAAFLRIAFAGLVHEDLPHDPRTEPPKMRSIRHPREPLIHEPEVDFVHERGRLERRLGLALQLLPGEAAQLVVDRGQERAEGDVLAAAVALQQLGERLAIA